jgi:hypothetical protein
MATLPDLDTSNISYIAYWNAIDQGGIGSIDPEEVLSDGNINSYTLYDNGIQIDSYSTPTGRNIQARVKTDGWIVAYLDRTENYGTLSGSVQRGWWDFANDWTDALNLSSFTNNTLERAIYSLHSQLSNSGSITYNTSDVALYNYEYPDATATTGMAMKTENDNSKTSGFSYTSSTTIYAGAAVATAYNNNTGSNYARAKFEGTKIAEVSDSINYGSIDLVGDGYIPNSGTEYQATNNTNWATVELDIIIMWG